MRYFDINDWKLDEISEDLRQRIKESKQPLPKKVMKHSIFIVEKTGQNCYCYSHYNSWYYPERDFKDREDAVKYLNGCGWLKRTSDNCWCDVGETRTYKDENNDDVLCHYEIRESDYEDWEDNEYHIEYSDDEKEMLRNILYQFEYARFLIKAYDRCCDNCGFGNGGLNKFVTEELKDFKETYTEEPQEISDDE